MQWNNRAGRDDAEAPGIAHGLRLTAYGPNEDEMRIVEDLPKAKTPQEQESIQRQIAATDKRLIHWCMSRMI
jgi:hypothetical protein